MEPVEHIAPHNTHICEVQTKENLRAQFASIPLRVGPLIIAPIECPTNCPGPLERTVEYKRVLGVFGKQVLRTEVSCFITGRSTVRSWLDESLQPSTEQI